jgi:hypothetical protein
VNSPLVARFIGLNKTNSRPSYEVNLSLSHFPERQLTTLVESEGFNIKKPRSKIVHHDSIRSFLKDSRKQRNKMLEDFQSDNTNTSRDIRKLKQGFTLSLKWIEAKEKESVGKKKVDLIDTIIANKKHSS